MYRALVNVDGEEILAEARTFTTAIIPVEGISFEKTSLDLHYETVPIHELATIVFQPEDASNKGIKWSIADNSIATYYSGSKPATVEVTPVKPGHTILTAISEDGQFSADCDIRVSGIMVQNQYDLCFEVGETYQLDVVVFPVKPITFTSSDESIVTISSTGLITAVSPGSTEICIECGEFSNYYNIEIDHRIQTSGAVDLGLSVKWAACNLGGDRPELNGDFFAWGDPAIYYEEGQANYYNAGFNYGYLGGYIWDNYKWTDNNNNLIKYNCQERYGIVDNKLELSDYYYEDDAARIILGGTWRLPTYSEIQELVELCSWQQAKRQRYRGVIVTGPNGNSIFIPLAGYRDKRDYISSVNFDSIGKYWSSSVIKDSCLGAYYLSITAGLTPSVLYYGLNHISGSRCRGYSIRPVTE